MLVTCEKIEEFKATSIDWYFSTRFSFDFVSARKAAKAGCVCGVSDVDKYSCRSSSISWGESVIMPLREIESCYEFYRWVLLMLHAVHSLECKENENDSKWFVDLVKQLSMKPRFIRSKYHNFPTPLKAALDSSQLYALKAQDLMDNLTGLNDDLEFQLLSQMSKILLWKAIQNETSKTNAVSRLSLAYLAALYFATSEYETAIDLCWRVITNQTNEKTDLTLNAGCLLYIDDIAGIIGFYLLFRQIS